MKSSQIILVLVVAAAAGLVIATHLDAQARAPVPAGPIAVCNVPEIINNYQKAKDFNTKLTKEVGEMKKEDDKLAEAIAKLTKELKVLASGSEQYEQRFTERQRLQIDRDAWVKFKQAQVVRRRQKLTREMYDEVQEAVGSVAKRRGFKIVLYQQRGKLRATTTTEMLAEISQRKVVYSDETIDITASVLTSLNAAYQRK